MDLFFTEEHRAFRREARDWLAAHVPEEPLDSMDTATGFEQHRAWERTLHAGGWSVVSWPPEYGGRDADLLEWLVFEEEYYLAGAPGRVNQNGLFMMGPTLLDFGADEQRARWLPPMAAGDHIWCQGWSEPDAGSDLASLRSRAVRTGDGYRLNGQKTWVSRGVWADWMFGLFRTGPEEDRHRALTFIVVPMDSDGVTTRPIRQLDGDEGFAEVFLEDVEVPADHAIGEENAGWKVAMATAGFERGVLLRSPGRFLAAARRLLDLSERRGGDRPELQPDVVRSWMAAEAYRLATYSTVSKVMQGAAVGPEASLNKLFWSQMDLRLHQTALRMLGPLGELAPQAPGVVDRGAWLDGWLFALAGPIYAGTNQIQRDIVADRVLQLPRSR